MAGARTPEEVAAHNRAVEARFGESLRRMAALEVADPHEVRIVRDLEFARPDGAPPLLLDLYLAARPPGRPPVVVWLHGGAWKRGDRAFSPDLERYFAARGYAMVNIEYRLSGQWRFPAQLDDVRAAVRWVRAHADEYGLDADRVALWGSSAGAHLAALAATTARSPEDRVQAVVDGYGPTDLARADEQALPGGQIHDVADSPESELLGGRLGAADPELLRAANPVAHVTAEAPPFLILHGTADLLVPPGQSQLLHDALVRAGVESTLYLIDGLDHGFFNGRAFEVRPCPAVRVRTNAGGPARELDGPPATFELIERFLDRHLRRDPWSR
jgi:acetyl esterase/lipase